MPKKVAIFLSGYITERGGGPPATPYNLQAGLRQISNEHTDETFRIGSLEVDFVSRGIRVKEPEVAVAKPRRSLIKKILRGFLFSPLVPPGVVWAMRDWQQQRWFRGLPDRPDITRFEDAAVVELHGALDYDLVKKVIPKKAIKILMVHTPEGVWEEFRPLEMQRKCEREIREMEQSAFEWADVLWYTCEETLEGHFNIFPYLKELAARKKVVYCPIGIAPLFVRQSKKELRTAHGIPEDAFVVSYVGRHIGVKGFDLLAEAVMRVNERLDDAEKVYLLSAGKGDMADAFAGNESLRPVWKHVEWTDAPGDIIAASDCFVLPNRETYFDLVLLEALSVGVPILATDTGGNKYVGRMSHGIELRAPTVDDIAAGIERMRTRLRAERDSMAARNQDVFAKHFTQRAFAENYVRMISSLVEGGASSGVRAE